ncbi:hypothetical protein [Pontixanthobacter sp.]|uniref:hypothetical protein n=1 Tax=Pontixanthobacter sp. TaxID=2792078 RepID=UPI003C7CE6A6
MEDNFQKACDTLSSAVDDTQYERFRWTRDEAPRLARMAQLLRAAFDKREDFELAEEGATSTVKRFVIKVHGQRTVAVSMCLKDGQTVMDCSTVERSRFALAEGAPITDDYEHLDECWIEQALQLVIMRIIPAGDKPAAKIFDQGGSGQQEAA